MVYLTPFESHFCNKVGNLKRNSPIEINHILDEMKITLKKIFAKVDEGQEKITIEALNKLRPVFKNGGTVTAGNSSNISCHL